MTSSISSRVPASPASSTGDSPSSASCISLASRISVRSGASPDSATTMIGNSEKLISEICQLSAPAGKLRLGAAHGVAHIGDGGGLVPAELELQEQARETLRTRWR
jgi:hypothetical protein